MILYKKGQKGLTAAVTPRTPEGGIDYGALFRSNGYQGDGAYTDKYHLDTSGNRAATTQRRSQGEFYDPTVELPEGYARNRNGVPYNIKEAEARREVLRQREINEARKTRAKSGPTITF